MPFDELISEPIVPTAGSFDAAAMARGEAGLPSRFTWRNVEYQVAELIESWKTSTPEGGSGEMYLRRHWFRVRTTGGDRMTLYCDRQTKNRKHPKARWWLYTVQATDDG